ncbi:MAG: hypothetical protein ACREDR_46205, partial [Blastocatellia bacterium]
MPAVAASKDRFAITGNGFQGDADRNRIDLGGNSAFVLAASPRELVILASPQTAAGTVELAVTIGAEQVSTQITLVDIFPDAIRNGVSPGKSGKFVLHVRGTIHPLDLDVQNMSPEIVRFKHGDHGYLRTRGGADNSARIEVKGERTGEFSYAVRLRPQPGIANVDVARDILQATEKLAKSEEKRRIEKILAKLRPRNVDIRGARKEFARIPTV